MNTKEYLSKILPTVKDLLLCQGHKQESEILLLGNMTYEEDVDGYGNDYDLVIIDVQTDKYVSLQKNKAINEIENVILSAFRSHKRRSNTKRYNHSPKFQCSGNIV